MVQWIITGGSSGIGAQLAQDLLADGEDVTVWDLQAPGTDWRGGFHAVDLSEPDAIVAAAQLSSATLHAFVHCAGISAPVSVNSVGLAAAMRKTFDIHAVAFAVAVQALLPRLQAGRGSVVAVTSASMDIVYPGTLAYGASKAALRRCVDQLSVELAPLGIRVNGVAPGAIATPMTAARWADPQFSEQRSASIPLGFQAKPKAISDAIRFLASNGASYITGENLFVDGGARHGHFNQDVRAAAHGPTATAAPI